MEGEWKIETEVESGGRVGRECEENEREIWEGE
jgi:hypothetical protein